MKKTISQTLVAFIGLSAFHSAIASEWTGHVSGYIGNKTVQEDDWANHDEHGSMGVITDFKQTHWPVSIAIDLFATGNEDSVSGLNQKTYSAQAHIGARKIFHFEDCRIHPYVGGGIALSSIIQKNQTSEGKKEFDDHDVSGWIGTGAYVYVTNSVTVGADLRYSKANVELNEASVDASGTMAGLTLGYHW